MAPVCHHLALGTRGLGTGSRSSWWVLMGMSSGHRSDLLLRALVHGFCFSTHQRPPLHAIVGTRWHSHPPSRGACTSLWPPGHFWLHSLLVPQLQGSPGSIHVTRTLVSSLGVPPVPAWRGALVSRAVSLLPPQATKAGCRLWSSCLARFPVLRAGPDQPMSLGPSSPVDSTAQPGAGLGHLCP